MEVILQTNEKIKKNKSSSKIHPYKFTMYLAIMSIIMMFAGLTSAYVVKSTQANWLPVSLNVFFAYSSITTLCSSAFLYLSLKYFNHQNRVKFNIFYILTLILALLFVMFQLLGFRQLTNSGILLSGNVSGSFVYVIAIVHLLHVLGGIIALLILWIRYNKKTNQLQTSLALQVSSIYWHFVSILWIYLYSFFLFMK